MLQASTNSTSARWRLELGSKSSRMISRSGIATGVPSMSSGHLINVVDIHILLALTSLRVLVPAPSVAMLCISTLSRTLVIHVIPSVQIHINFLHLNILGLMSTATTSSPVSLLLHGREAITQVLQGLGIALAAVILVHQLLSSAPSASSSGVHGSLVLLLQQVVILLAIVILLAAPLLVLLLSSPWLRGLGTEGIIVIQE